MEENHSEKFKAATTKFVCLGTIITKQRMQCKKKYGL